MNLPKINAGATDRNREQSERICELKGWRYAKFPDYTKAQMPVDCKDGRCKHDISVGRCHEAEDLPNGSFTLDQVVGMLESEGWFWMATNEKEREKELDEGAWWSDMGGYTVMTARAHDLTAAMDALIAMLEEKKP